jgi:hypothetical protein
MPLPCSLRSGVVRSHHATEVRALRPPPLPFAAGELLKITGASRRSAAPGSQKVGVAEYGDVVFTQSPAAMVAAATGNYRGARLKPWRAAVLPSAATGYAGHPVVPLPSSAQLPESRRNAWAHAPQLKPSPSKFARSHTALSFVRTRSLTRSHHLSHARISFPSAAMPHAPRTAANPSFNLTRSGLRPPRAS